MKNIYINIGFFIGIIVLLGTNACKDNINPPLEELDFVRVFTPLELTAKISNQTTLELNWGFNKGISSYVVEISQDSLDFSDIIYTATVALNELPFVYALPSGDTQYSARVKGVSSTAGVEDSKWSAIAFKSLPENLFEGYQIKMTAIGAITVSWLPGKAVTALTFVTQSGETSFDITAEEATAGSKSVTGVANAVYEIRLMNNAAVRGTQNYVLEGDVLVASGTDLAAAIAAASAGDVIVLEENGMYPFVGDLTIDKSLKIKGIDGIGLPVLYLTSGDRMFYIGSSLTPADSLVFENLYISGFINHNAGDGQHRGIFDMESEACNLGALKFIGCKLYDLGRQVLRLRGGSDQTIGLFLVDDCIIHNLGNSSASYGVLSADQTNTNVKIIKVMNSTIDSLKSHFLRYDDATDCESITLQNCTFNRTPYSSGRYFSDTRNAVITDGFYVTNCIFGSTSYGDTPSIYGIRVADGVALTIKNSYSTSDFVLSDYSVMNDQLTPLEITSDALWSDPTVMDFTFKGAGIDAGDPRWK